MTIFRRKPGVFHLPALRSPSGGGSGGSAPNPNLLLKSEDWTSASWSKNQNAIVADVDTNPVNASQTADGLRATAVSASHNVMQSVPTTATPYTLSVYAKAGNASFIGVGSSRMAAIGVMFDLTNGLVGQSFQAGAVTPSIVSLGSGWYRCIVTFTPTAGANNVTLYQSMADWAGNGTNSHIFTGDGATVNTILWGAQFELGSSATTYTPNL